MPDILLSSTPRGEKLIKRKEMFAQPNDAALLLGFRAAPASQAGLEDPPHQ
jgi:hypothetical protein